MPITEKESILELYSDVNVQTIVNKQPPQAFSTTVLNSSRCFCLTGLGKLTKYHLFPTSNCLFG